jgi:two-component system, NarL family, nitrate/nitrite response regulator NarL
MTDSASSAGSTRRIRVLIAAGYPSVRAGLAALLGQTDDIELVSAESSEIDVIVADVDSLSDERLDRFAELDEAIAFVYLGGDPAVEGIGLGDGAVAYLSPEAGAEHLALAVRGVASGLSVIDPALLAGASIRMRSPAGASEVADVLTNREHEVLDLVAAGYPNKTIAHELGISEHTAKFHVGSLLSKLGAASRAEAVMIATRRGLLPV